MRILQCLKDLEKLYKQQERLKEKLLTIAENIKQIHAIINDENEKL